jgi:hypothetical protein
MKKLCLLISTLLYMHPVVPKALAQGAGEKCDWYCQLMKEASAPIPVAIPQKPTPPTPLTPQQIGSQLAQLSNSDRSLALREAAAQLATPLPTGTQKTGPFFTGLGTAFTSFKTLTSKIKASPDLRDQLPIIIPAAQSELLYAAAF